jgi:hypothetical protein
MHPSQVRCAVLMCVIGILLANVPWHFSQSFARTASVAATVPAPTLTELGRLSGTILSVQLQGDIAVVGDQQGILLLDVSNSTSPTQISRLQLGGQIKDLFLRNNLVYAANTAGFLQIVDIANPFAPRLRGQLALPVSGQGIDIVDDRAAIAAHNGGLLIVDIHNPDAPILLGGSGPVLGSTFDVRYIGDRVYVASLGGLHIFDVSDPAHPTQLGFYDAIKNNVANGQAVDVDGDYAYLAVGGAGLLILDVSVPAAPRLIASIDTAGFTTGVQVVGSKAYLAEREGGLQVVDLQTPSQPHLVGALDTAGYVCRLSVVGNLAYLADSSGGLIVADVSQTQPVLHGFYGVGGGSTEMAVVGDRLYISSYEGLVIADISTPNRPQVLGTLVLPGFAYTIVASGTTIFLGNDLRKQNNNFNDWQVTAVDVADPTAPHILSTVTFTAASVMDLALIGTTLYVATGNLGLQLINVADPHAPVQLGAASAVSGSYISSIVMEGNLAYLSTNTVLDVSVPTVPSLVATLNLPNSVVRDAIGPTVYSVETIQIDSPFPYRNPPEYRSTLKIVDVSIPQALQVTSVYTPTQGRIQDVKVRDNVAYVLTTAGLDLVNVSDPISPTLLATPPLSAVPSTLLFSDDILFGAGYMSGVQLYATSQHYVPSSLSVNGETRLTSTDGSINLLFGGADTNASISVAQMDRLTPSQASNGTRNVERSFLVEARNDVGSRIGQATKPYTLEVSMPTNSPSATSHPGVAYWNGEKWVDLSPCNVCGAQPSKLIVQTDHFGELAVVLDAPVQPEQPTNTPTPSPPEQPTNTPTPSPVVPPVQNAQHRLFLPVICL